MEFDRWRQIKELCRTAMTRPITERDAFLTKACANDDALRQGIESLLTIHLDGTTRAEAESRTTRLFEQEDEPMTPQRWQRIEQIFQAAAECNTEGLAAFLDHACGDDQDLRLEVEALLVFQQPAPSFIQGVVHGAAAAINPKNVRSAKPKPMSEDLMFVPGAILAGRYRIIGPLGRGGMGEVYRADDLKLGQAVALKFLTESFARDGAMLARFHGEVRVARQVTHPNVCRVHDIGEIHTEFGGQHFLSMEYVDGEDLSSLLRRIGRLPSDKAVEIARQLCAGIAAAHEAGVLHRDLKPANVMIDGRGRARITDFGLAGLAEQFRGREVMAGTPAYMAPEQLAGKEVTVKSDIYALGLVLYELFTGKRVFDTSSIDELRRLHESSSPTNPSSWVKDIDPLVERVILRCLEKDPEKRPASALQVATALPGGDPLAAAIAAGETPSPEMVAAAPKLGSLKPSVAILALVSVVAGVIALLFFSQQELLHNRVNLDKPPEVLVDRAESLLKKYGYTALPADRAYGFGHNEEYETYLKAQKTSREGWNQAFTGQPPLLYFWHRQSPKYLEPQQFYAVSENDPPLSVAGMTQLTLDPHGRLVKFQAVPPQIETTPSAAMSAPDWKSLFDDAGLDFTKFKPVASQWTPPFHSDARGAWEGQLPEPTAFTVRVEAAAYHNQPIYFEIVGAWSQPGRVAQPQADVQLRAFQMLIFAIFVMALLAGAVLARRNLRLGRGDRRGAFRVAAFSWTVSYIGWIFGASHVPTLAGEIRLFIGQLARVFLSAGILWLFYIALEPYMRRHWPERIVSWSRVLAGGWRDPLVGRDILAGLGIGVWIIPLSLANNLAQAQLGTPKPPDIIHLNTLLGLSKLIQELAGSILPSLVQGVGLLFVLLLLTILLRREWIAASVLWLLYTAGLGLAFGSSVADVAYFGAAAAAHIFIMMRFGLLAFIVAHACLLHSERYPLTTDFSAWYAPYSHFAVLGMLAVAGYGFYLSLAGQPLFRRNLIDPEPALPEKS